MISAHRQTHKFQGQFQGRAFVVRQPTNLVLLAHKSGQRLLVLPLQAKPLVVGPLFGLCENVLPHNFEEAVNLNEGLPRYLLRVYVCMYVRLWDRHR